MQQSPGPDGKRHSRWAIIRNSYPELRTTTIKSWLDWFPEEHYGRFKWHPPPYEHHIRVGDLDMENYFIALDKPDDVKKMLSLELTGAFINEAREVPKAIVDAVSMRVGRYPSMKDGGPSWYGVIMDTNAPDEEHWWAIMSGAAPAPDYMTNEEKLLLVKPDTWEFYDQPPAMVPRREKGELVGYDLNPQRENANNLTPDYYPRIIQGKTATWIKVYVCNELGKVVEGRLVYSAHFLEGTHVVDELEPVPHVPLTVGVDFGLSPAAVIGQQVRGRWRVLKELIGRDMGATRFAPLLKSVLQTEFPGFRYNIWGDPAGDERAQTDENTPFRVFRSKGLPIRAAPSNDPELRLGAVTTVLDRMVEGKPAYQVSRTGCPVLVAGFTSGYVYSRITGTSSFTDSPVKNAYSHPHDAHQYMMLGGGEGRALVSGGEAAGKVTRMDRLADPFSRARSGKKRKNRAPAHFTPLSS